MNSLSINKKDFYHEFTLRNAGFISEQEQAVLRDSVILVAGCGSTGGSAIELLVRSGAENLILIDNGTYDLNNSNRQNMTLDDVGELKPEVFRLRCNAINPFAKIEGVPPFEVSQIWSEINRMLACTRAYFEYLARFSEILRQILKNNRFVVFTCLTIRLFWHKQALLFVL